MSAGLRNLALIKLNLLNITNMAENQVLNGEATAPAALNAADAAQMANNHAGSITFGPLNVSWSLDLGVPQFVADVKLFGAAIGHAVLNPQNPTVKIGGNVGLARAELDLTADFSGHRVSYDAEVGFMGRPVIDKSGTLFSW